MFNWLKTLLNIVFLTQGALVLAYSSGAPKDSCHNLQHQHYEAAGLLIPMEMNDKDAYKLAMARQADGSYMVSLTSERDDSAFMGFIFSWFVHLPDKSEGQKMESIRGFIIQVRHDENFNQGPVGHFDKTDNYNVSFRTMDCLQSQDSITHSVSKGRSIVRVIWHPPRPMEGKVYAIASITEHLVQSLSRLKSELYHISTSAPPTTESPVTSTTSNEATTSVTSTLTTVTTTTDFKEEPKTEATSVTASIATSSMKTTATEDSSKTTQSDSTEQTTEIDIYFLLELTKFLMSKKPSSATFLSSEWLIVTSALTYILFFNSHI